MNIPCKHSLCHGILLPRNQAPLFMQPQHSLHEGMLDNSSWASIAVLFHDQLAVWFAIQSPSHNMPQKRTWTVNHGQGGLAVGEWVRGRAVGVGHVHFRDGPLQPFGDFPQTILDHASLARRSSEDFSCPGMGQSIRPLLWNLHQNLLCRLKATTDGLQQTLTQDYRCNSGHQAKHLWSDVGGDGDTEHPRQWK